MQHSKFSSSTHITPYKRKHSRTFSASSNNIIKTFSLFNRTVRFDVSWLIDMALITLILGLIWGLNLANQPLLVPDSARYAEIPREMLVSGDWITPHLNGVKYFEKPPLFYWLQLLVFKTIGVSANTAMIANVLLSIGIALETYWLGRRAFTRAKAIVATLAMASSLMSFVFTRVLTLDVLLSFCITLSLGGFWLRLLTGRTRYILVAYLGLALGVLSKGLVGALLPGLVLFSWLILDRRWQTVKSLVHLPSILIAIAIILPWHLAVQHLNPEFNHFYFIEQHFARFFTDYARRQQPAWFFLATLVIGWYPWTIIIVDALRHQLTSFIFYVKKWRLNLAKWPGSATRCLFLILWPAVIVGFFTLSQSKLIPYILPAWPPLALLAGNYLVNVSKARTHYFDASSLTSWLNLILLIAILIVFICGYLPPHLKPIDTPCRRYLVLSVLFSSFMVASYFQIKKSFNYPLFIIAGLTTIPFYLAISSYIPRFNSQSNYAIIKPIKLELAPQDTVIAYGDYFQDLPFYLNRTIVVVGDGDELAFGASHQLDARKWMWSYERFNRCLELKLRGDNKALTKNQCFHAASAPSTFYYIVTKYRNLQQLKRKWPALNKWRYLGETGNHTAERRVVITDKPY